MQHMGEFMSDDIFCVVADASHGSAWSFRPTSITEMNSKVCLKLFKRKCKIHVARNNSLINGTSCGILGRIPRCTFAVQHNCWIPIARALMFHHQNLSPISDCAFDLVQQTKHNHIWKHYCPPSLNDYMWFNEICCRWKFGCWAFSTLQTSIMIELINE